MAGSNSRLSEGPNARRVLSLERALEAAEQGEHAEVLAELLAHWQRSRSPEVAQLIDLVPGVERAHEGVFSRIRSDSLSQALREMEYLDAQPEDPRTTRGLFELLSRPPFEGSESADFWELVLSRLVQLTDVRVASSVRELLDSNDLRPEGFLKYFFQDKLKRARDRLWARLSDRTEGLTQAEMAILELLKERLAPARPKTKLELLWEQIIQAPQDLEARLVYADALMEHGDPRGEFIALQCARSVEAQPSSRECALLQAHGREWLGRAGVLLNVDRVVYVQGTVVSVELGGHSSWRSRGAPVWEWALSEPLWATVGKLGIGAHFPAAPLARILKRRQDGLHTHAIADTQVLNPNSRFRRQLEMRSLGVSTLELGFTHFLQALREFLGLLATPFWKGIQTIVLRPEMVCYLSRERLRGVLEALSRVSKKRPLELVMVSESRNSLGLVGTWLEEILELRPEFTKIRIQTKQGDLVLSQIRTDPFAEVSAGEGAEALKHCLRAAGILNFSSGP